MWYKHASKGIQIPENVAKTIAQILYYKLETPVRELKDTILAHNEALDRGESSEAEALMRQIYNMQHNIDNMSWTLNKGIEHIIAESKLCSPSPDFYIKGTNSPLDYFASFIPLDYYVTVHPATVLLPMQTTIANLEHELTHARDHQFKEIKGRDVSYSGSFEYYNTPEEVHAYTNSIYSELTQAFDKETLMKSRNLAELLFEQSPYLKKAWENFTPKNKNYIMKTLYQRIHDVV